MSNTLDTLLGLITEVKRSGRTPTRIYISPDQFYDLCFGGEVSELDAPIKETFTFRGLPLYEVVNDYDHIYVVGEWE